jgi:hypothetical protein
MTLPQAVFDALVSVSIVAVAIFCGYRVVVWARRRAKGAYVVAALLSPILALGKVTDPDFRIVMEAKQHKKREEDEPGDPPSLEDELGLEPDNVEDAPRRPKSRKRTAWWRFWRR